MCHEINPVRDLFHLAVAWSTKRRACDAGLCLRFAALDEETPNDEWDIGRNGQESAHDAKVVADHLAKAVYGGVTDLWSVRGLINKEGVCKKRLTRLVAFSVIERIPKLALKRVEVARIIYATVVGLNIVNNIVLEACMRNRASKDHQR